MGKRFLVPTCLVCRCTERAACSPPCSWSLLNTRTNEGLCSACHARIKLLPRARRSRLWQAGDLTTAQDLV